jgi:hypothetical protein
MRQSIGNVMRNRTRKPAPFRPLSGPKSGISRSVPALLQDSRKTTGPKSVKASQVPESVKQRLRSGFRTVCTSAGTYTTKKKGAATQYLLYPL